MVINMTIPEQLLKDLNEYCERNELQRSEFIRHLIRLEIYHEKSLDKENPYVKNEI